MGVYSGVRHDEAAPLITTSIIRDTQQHLDPEEKYRLKAKAGYEFIGSEVKVVNENGDEVAPDGKEIGEIIVRSNTVMEGYWNNPEETHKAIRDGFYHTGDMALVDEEGNIEIADRKKILLSRAAKTFHPSKWKRCCMITRLSLRQR